MSVQIKDYLKARRDRALGSILGHVERSFQEKLSEPEWAEFRGTTIDALNNYHDSILDLVKSEDGVERNQEAIQLLRAIERHIVGSS